MIITFNPLQKTHFPLLLKWLKAPHVKTWWGKGIVWTQALIEEKYGTYPDRYRIENDQKKPFNAYILSVDDIPIGYIQLFSIDDFPREDGYFAGAIPQNCAAMDWYIGEPDYLGKGIGTKALDLFLNTIAFKTFNAVCVDPDAINVIAIRVYEKVGFKIIEAIGNKSMVPMLKSKDS